MKILAAQLNFTIGDFSGNTQKIISALASARDKGADIVLFPELALCGYPPEDLLLHHDFVDEVEKHLAIVARQTKGLFVAVGTVRKAPGKGQKPLGNSVAIICDGKILGYQDKILLPTYDVFDELRYFEPGDKLSLWEHKGKKIGLLVCEDIWQHSGYVGHTSYLRDPVKELAALKPDIVLNLSASPYQFNKPNVRVDVCAKAAKEIGCPVVLCCQVGGNDELIFDGYSVYVDASAQLRQLGRGFEEDEMLIDLSSAHSFCPLTYDPLEDLYRALVLGVRDYFHKSGFKKGCLGLSGGIDSALVACIAADALGKDNVLGIAMPSRYSSMGSVSDAHAVARHLGIQCLDIPIEGPFSSFLSLMEPTFRGRKSDVTEENMQARIRGMILMAISNKFGHVVLSTGNKSEMAMGYCTLYGDMCGGLSVIADVTKTQVYALSRWINREKEIIPLSTIEKPPSAELRPNQKDSDSLPDYAILDKILHAYIEDCLSIEMIAKTHHLDISLVEDVVRKVHRAEYKRRQAAPGLRVSKKAFRVGRKYPIVQRWVH